MATVPLMLKAVEDKNYKIASSTEEGLEGKIIISILFDIGGQKCLLTRYVNDISPLNFNRAACLQILKENEIEFQEEIHYLGKENSAEIIFKEVEKREPEYLRTW